MAVEASKIQDSLFYSANDKPLNVKELKRETLTFRLSKQEKYILQLLFNHKSRDWNKERGFYGEPNYLDLHNNISRKVAKKFNREFTNSHYASFSRAIKTLEKNGLIEIGHVIVLTDKGIDKAKQLFDTKGE
jgi:hypothetical protein